MSQITIRIARDDNGTDYRLSGWRAPFVPFNETPHSDGFIPPTPDPQLDGVTGEEEREISRWCANSEGAGQVAALQPGARLEVTLDVDTDTAANDAI